MKTQDQEMMAATPLAVVVKQAVEAAEQVVEAGGMDRSKHSYGCCSN
jgi:hypothetical protein